MKCTRIFCVGLLLVASLTVPSVKGDGYPPEQGDETRVSQDWRKVVQKWSAGREASLRDAAGENGANLWALLDQHPQLKKEFLTLADTFEPAVYSQFNVLAQAKAVEVAAYPALAITLAVNHGQTASFYTVWGGNKKPDLVKTFQWFFNNADQMSIQPAQSPLELLLHITDLPSLDVVSEGDWALKEYQKPERKITGSYGHPPYRHLKGWLKKAGEENEKVKLYHKRKADIEQHVKHTLPHNLLDGGVCFHKSYYGTRVLKYHGYASIWQSEKNHAYVVGIYYDKAVQKYKTNIQHNYGRMGGKNYYQKKGGLGQKTTTDMIKLCAGLNKGRESYIAATLAARVYASMPMAEKIKSVGLIEWAINQNPDAWMTYHVLLQDLAKPGPLSHWKKTFALAKKSGAVEPNRHYVEMRQKAVVSGVENPLVKLSDAQKRVDLWASLDHKDAYAYTAMKMQMLAAHGQSEKAIQLGVAQLQKPTNLKSASEVSRQVRLICGKGKKQVANPKKIFSQLTKTLPHYCNVAGGAPKNGKARPNRCFQETAKTYLSLIKKDQKMAAESERIKGLLAKAKKAKKTNAIPQSAKGESADPAFQRWLGELNE